MPQIVLKTEIDAPKSLVFDLCRNIDLHKISASQTGESAVAGRTTGLIELNETVTWKARHFGMMQTLTSRITELRYPDFFTDEMVKGPFRFFRHEHIFEDAAQRTIMTDLFEYEAPFGWLGRIADQLFLERYMTRFLSRRNRVILEFAESGQWKELPSVKKT
ncbi:SRPBCC family protein [Robertkochia solimangrovi]|uniref:SRPBCC family protein n=1 Tax=Robertkochia solimangrovi TaxID=2213046 RepID=UPI00117DAD52|nr:SRPBCC family protein [Robertkochia solimangrovi]TRZ42319.1 cell division protein [Robertkochia solimangrovi]